MIPSPVPAVINHQQLADLVLLHHFHGFHGKPFQGLLVIVIQFLVGVFAGQQAPALGTDCWRWLIGFQMSILLRRKSPECFRNFFHHDQSLNTDSR